MKMAILQMGMGSQLMKVFSMSMQRKTRSIPSAYSGTIAYIWEALFQKCVIKKSISHMFLLSTYIAQYIVRYIVRKGCF